MAYRKVFIHIFTKESVISQVLRCSWNGSGRRGVGERRGSGKERGVE